MDQNISVKKLRVLKDIRASSKAEVARIRKERRSQVLLRKRLNPYSSELVGCISDEVLTESIIRGMVLKLKKYSTDIKAQIQALRRAFCSRPDLISVFFEVENSVRTIVSHLTSKDSELHLETAWCIATITFVEHNRILTMVKLAAPYLIAYLGTGNPAMQEICLCALGNLAAENEKARKLLRSQGAIKPILHSFKSSNPEVIQAAAFTCINLAQDQEMVELFTDVNIKEFIELLKNTSITFDFVKEMAWLIFFVSYKINLSHEIQSELILVCSFWFSKAIKDSIHNYSIYVPLVRILGNIASENCHHCVQIAESENMLNTIANCCFSTEPPIRKEILWFLCNLLTCDKVLDLFYLSDINLGDLLEQQFLWNMTEGVKRQAILCLNNLMLVNHTIEKGIPSRTLLQSIVTVMMSSENDLKYNGL